MIVSEDMPPEEYRAIAESTARFAEGLYKEIQGLPWEGELKPLTLQMNALFRGRPMDMVYGALAYIVAHSLHSQQENYERDARELGIPPPATGAMFGLVITMILDALEGRRDGPIQ